MSPTSLCGEIGQAPTQPTVTPPTYGEGEKQRSISYDCPTTNPLSETGSISYTVSGVLWDPPLPSALTNSFSSTAYVNVSSSESNLCPMGRVNIGTVSWVVSCNLSHYTTNCTAGKVVLTNGTITTNVCFISQVSASVSTVLSNAIKVITSHYTNACGNVDTNCPATKITNAIPPTIVSNWWVATGPGSFSKSGSGTSAAFTPTNGGSGSVTFNCTYTDGCETNLRTAPTLTLPYNVIQITNECAAAIPTPRGRLTIGVGEYVDLSLVGGPSGTFTWSTSAGSVSPTTGPTTRLTAPSNAATATVTVTCADGTACQRAFEVKAPESATASTNGAGAPDAFAAGAQGVCMRLWFTIAPTNVSLARVEMVEVAGPASNITGYCTNAGPGNPPHVPNPAYIALNANNRFGIDHCHHAGRAAPWHDGGFDWVIPVKWKIVGSTVTNDFGTWTQSFRLIGTNGTSSVSKAGAYAERTP